MQKLTVEDLIQAIREKLGPNVAEQVEFIARKLVEAHEKQQKKPEK